MVLEYVAPATALERFIGHGAQPPTIDGRPGSATAMERSPCMERCDVLRWIHGEHTTISEQ
eukprot:EC791687.1.p3 GENE.EC791687.1~~EC791687.1.p3  ORF type:complete len:61 (+),score=3.42 EC791687.1:386-568(+)